MTKDINNFETLQKSKQCGCLECGKIFSPSEIKEWIETEREKTALCPYCGIDRVFGDYNYDLENITKAKYWEEKRK